MIFMQGKFSGRANVDLQNCPVTKEELHNYCKDINYLKYVKVKER